MTRFHDVQLDPCFAAEDGLHLRFKLAGEPRVAREVPYESEDGVAGRWRVAAIASDDDERGAAATAVLVEDSSDGLAWLIAGGRAGLRLEHVATGAIAREPYLLLSHASAID